MTDFQPERKRVRVRRDQLARARAILGTQNDAQTVAEALDLVVYRRKVSGGIRRISGTNGIRDIYEAD